MSKDRILFVEDDSETANMLRMYFESQGYEVMQAAWGRDGIELARAHPPDLIVLDINLPDIDGYEVCHEIRRNWRTSQTPVIFLTEKKERDSRIAGLKLGATDYLTKPFDVQELRLRVRNALNRAKFESLVDPITGLPGDRLIDARLSELLHHREWAVLLVSLLGLDEFGERYGFVSKNEVLRAAGLVLSKSTADTGTPDDFLGDAGRGDFIVITDPDGVATVQERIESELKRALTYFYPVAARSGGANDLGASNDVPILSIAIGGLRGSDVDQPLEDVAAVIAAVLSCRTVQVTIPG